MDHYSLHHLSWNSIYIPFHGSCGNCQDAIHSVLGASISSHSFLPLCVESKVDLRLVSAHYYETVEGRAGNDNANVKWIVNESKLVLKVFIFMDYSVLEF